MNLLKKMHKQRARDLELEATARIGRNVPQSYSRDDIERLEEEMVPWLAEKRRLNVEPSSR